MEFEDSIVGLEGSVVTLDTCDEEVLMELSCHLINSSESNIDNEENDLPIDTNVSSFEPPTSSTPRKPNFNCNECPYQSSSKNNFMRHCRRHGGVKSFSCDKCPKKFNEQYELKRHVRASHDPTGLLCEICSKRYKSHSGLLSHKRVAHQTNNHEKVTCNICNMIFYSKGDLKDHEINKHATTVQQKFKCNKCGTECSYQKTLKRHLKNCKGPRHVCELCSAELNSSQILKEHMVGKHGNTIHRCSCGKSYRWRASFQRHRRMSKHP